MRRYPSQSDHSERVEKLINEVLESLSFFSLNLLIDELSSVGNYYIVSLVGFSYQKSTCIGTVRLKS